MNLLTDRLPSEVWRVGDELYFDTDAPGDPDEVYDIAISYASIINIFAMLQHQGLTEFEKKLTMLRAFFLDRVPDDTERAGELCYEFMACGAGAEDKKDIQYYSWEQDGNYIYTAVNQSFSGVLDKEPDLHWWLFIAYFMDLTDGCRFNEIVANRYAHKKGKATKEQKEARRQYPEIYVLKHIRKTDTETLDRAKELERIMNAK